MYKFYAFLFAFILAANTTFAQFTLLNESMGLTEGIPLSNRIVFTSAVDNSLWVSEGTLLTTVQYSTDIRSNRTAAAVHNDKIYFSGINAANGGELFETDGTLANTKLTADINSGNASSDPDNFILYKGNLYFTATTSTLGREFYKYDFISKTASLVNEFATGNTDGVVDPAYYVFNNNLYISAKDGSNNALYLYDGTSFTKLITISANDSIRSFLPEGNKLFFSTVTPGLLNIDLYVTEGTPATTKLLHTSDLFASYTGSIAAFKNEVYFSGGEGELWKSDGTPSGTQLVKDINPDDPSNPFILNSVILNNRLIFMANGGASGIELWATDGTGAGTVLLKDINPGSGSSNPFLMPVYNLEFNASGEYQNFNYFDRNLNFNGSIFLSADDGVHGVELWKTDGTEAGTVMVKDINSSGDGVNFDSYYYVKTGLFFAGNNGTDGNEPWISDGSAGGTSQIENINPTGDADMNILFLYKGDLYINATNGNSAQLDLFKLKGPFISLPVTLIDLKAVATQNEVKLSWATTSEKNSDHFVVERSNDGNHFSEIGNVNASGTKSTATNYSFEDQEAYNQNASPLFYRLKMIDKDGRSVLSDIVSVNLQQSQLKFSIFPNPVNNIMNVSLGEGGKEGRLRIIDVTGKMILDIPVVIAANQMVQKIDVSRLNYGTYILQWNNGEQTQSVKFIKK